MAWLAIALTQALEQKKLLAIHNITQLKILALLDHEESLSAKKITARLKLKYKRVYKELQHLCESEIILKDQHNLYSLNPDYGEFLIEYGMKIKGMKRVPKAVIFIKKFDELKDIIEYLRQLLKGKVREE